MTSYPNNIWDGDSKNRDSDDAPRKAPDARDWIRLIEELAETQRQLDARAIDLDGKITVSYVYAGASNVLILEPGEGKALQADSNGDARGAYAVDLQMNRANDNCIAGGNSSVICGGFSNRTANNYGIIVGGYSNFNYGPYCVLVGGRNNLIDSGSEYTFIGGGQLNEITGDWSGICSGYDCTITGDYSIISGGHTNSIATHYNAICGGWDNHITDAGYCFIGAGYSCNINAAYACIIGSQICTVNVFHGGIYNSYEATVGTSANYGVIIGGKYATVDKYWGFASGGNVHSKNFGEVARASGKFNNDGDAQTSLYTARRTTTNASSTTLSLNNSAEHIELEPNRSYVFCAHVIARCAATEESAAYRVEGCVSRGDTTTTLKSTTTTTIHEDVGSWDALANAFSDKLYIYGHGEIGKTINWVARIEVTQVGE